MKFVWRGGCFQWFKDTNLKANHNQKEFIDLDQKLFPMVQRYQFESKSQLQRSSDSPHARCFQWFKDTNLKANHNIVVFGYLLYALFPMVQRY